MGRQWLADLRGLACRLGLRFVSLRRSARVYLLRLTEVRFESRHGRLRVRLPGPEPSGRPVELIARDVRRLGARFHYSPPGTSFAKLEGARRAYDHVLAEACTALGVGHLLGVLRAGEELDAERARVEGLLWLAGLRTDGPE